MSRILGLDLGPNSIGWALLDQEDETIIGTGVRIFQEGLNRPGGKEESKNATRRGARQARRMTARRNARRNKLIYVLTELGLLPEDDIERQSLFCEDPYLLRAKGLDRKLTLHELGRALYHINLRRGFKSNRKKDQPSETGALYEGSETKTGIDSTREEMKSGGFRTLGEYLNSLDSSHKRRRNRYTLRRWYIDEFNKLWDKQRRYYPEVLTEDAKQEVYDTIFHQRPLKSQKKNVRSCTFEGNKRAAAKSSPIYQSFRIHEQCSRLRITDGERHNCPLTQEEHDTLADALNRKEKLTLKQVAKLLKLSPEAHLNLADLPNIKGHSTNAKLAKVFGEERWYGMSEEERHEVWHTLHFYNDPPGNPNWLQDHAREKWGLDDDAVEKLMKTHLEGKYGQLSTKAMKNIVPYLCQATTEDEEPMTYDKACSAVGYTHTGIRTGMTRKRLPVPDDLRNPIVQQALYELRKVVNAIIDEYGKPDAIRVEVARDTKLPKWKRKGILALNRRREKERDELRQRLISEGLVADPKRDDFIKYELWEECNQTCPYTGRRIPVSQLFSNRWQIEHIIPYSRSLDDSQANKTLCERGENLNKRNKTPFEAYGGSEQYTQILDRVSKFRPMERTVRLNQERFQIKPVRNTKINKFKAEDVDKELSDEFIARQLVDTAYISRAVKDYLGCICEKVEPSPGRVTARLRYLWGLNSILSGHPELKQREDHRHHAVDALAVACTTPGYVHTMSRYHQYDREPGEEKFPLPWNRFWKDADASIKNILVSHKVNVRPRGPLHEETNYGRITLPDGTESFVRRKELVNFTEPEVARIVDPAIKALALERLDVTGKPPGEAFQTPLTFPTSDIPITKARYAVKTKEMLLLRPEQNLYVKYGKRHHVEIFENEGGRRTGRFVPLFDAAQRHRKGEPVIDKTPPEEGWRFVMSLCINELFLLDVEPDMIDWDNPLSPAALGTQLFRVQKMSVINLIELRHHTVSLSGQSDPGVERKTCNSLRGIKVSTDSLGRLSPVDD